LPSYFQGLNYIESDIQVSRHILGNAKHNFVATKLINFNNGLPQEEEQEEVESDLKKKFANHDGDRVVIAFNPSRENAVDIVNLGETSLTKEDFTNVNNLIQQEIFSCHQVTSPMLFGIKTEGQLGGRSEIRDAYQIFQNTYVNERQQEHEQTFSKLMNLAGIEGEHKIVPVEPLSFEFSEAVMSANMTRNEIREKLGLQSEVATDSWAQTFALLADTTPIDLSGSTILIQVRPTPTSSVVALELTTDDSSIGIGGVDSNQITLNKIVDIAAGTYVYDMNVTFPSGEVKTYLWGNFIVTEDISKAS